ncbi:MAG: hypothetical protein EB059_07190 [Alphaproteobacteria bacterium]|nr:hypothetical protein [Alphaproteobacteria bacterium]
MRNLFVFLTLACALTTFDVNAQGLATYSDWQIKWGTVDINSADDPIIPSIRHGVKKDLDTMITLCNSKLDGNGKHVPLDADYTKLKTYDIDFDSDGRPDTMLDFSTYFTGDQLATCPVQICSKEGCDMPLYRNDSDTQVIEGEASASNSCPETAELNTDCRKECSATEKQCPALFNHNRTLRWAGRMFGWSFISPDEYMAFREAIKNNYPDKTYIYREAMNKNPVFKVVRDASYCNLEEMDVNRNGIVSASEPCTKFLQFTTDKKLCKTSPDGCFVDMYYPKVLVSAQDDEARYIDWNMSDRKLNTFGAPTHFFDEAFAIKGRASTTIDGASIQGQGFRFKAGHALASQVPNFDVNAGDAEVCKDVEYEDQVCDQGVGEPNCHLETKHKQVCTKSAVNKQFVCKEYYNRSDKDVFIPAETDVEYQSFVTAVENNTLKDVSTRECERKFSPWTGPKSCAAIQLACNQVVDIRAERFCVRSTSSTGACGECAGKDTEVIDGFRDSCEFTARCVGAPCPSGHFCVAADTKIMMADGTEKEILSVHVGDMVKAFDSKDNSKTLKDAKVKAVMITGEQKIIALNDLKITSVHKVIMADGKKVMAKDIKIGDKILDAKNAIMTVNKITTDLNPTTVYNLDVEGADGYIAGGLKVMDYPAPIVK